MHFQTKSGVVHHGSPVSGLPGYVSSCNGKYERTGKRTDGEVTCKKCISKGYSQVDRLRAEKAAA